MNKQTSLKSYLSIQKDLHQGKGQKVKSRNIIIIIVIIFYIYFITIINKILLLKK